MENKDTEKKLDETLEDSEKQKKKNKTNKIIVWRNARVSALFFLLKEKVFKVFLLLTAV